MNTSTKHKLLGTICLLAASTWVNSAFASPIISGNSFIPDLSFVSADEIGYAAYDRTGGTSTDPWNTGFNNLAGVFSAVSGAPSFPVSASLDTSAQYLYLYQIINSTSGPVITNAFIPTSPYPTAVTSAGFFSQLTFNDGFGGVTVINPPLVTDTAGVLLAFYTPTVSLTNTNTILDVSGSLGSGDSASYIFGFTSNAAPFSAQVGNQTISSDTIVKYDPFTDFNGFHDGTDVAPGVVSIYHLSTPESIPEPTTLSLLSIALAGLGFTRRRKP